VVWFPQAVAQTEEMEEVMLVEEEKEAQVLIQQ
jgi:hypothetical protein